MSAPRFESFTRAAMLGLLAAAQAACVESGEDASGTGGSGNSDGAGAAGGMASVTSTEIVADLSLEDFTEMCEEAGGDIEIHPSCGGAVSGPGLSYDSDTDELTEHTCASINTCTGFSCVVDE